MSFYDHFREIDASHWSIEQLAYLLLHEADAAAVLAPTPEDMDAWLTVMSPGFVGIRDMKPANVSAESKTALTQSLGATLGVDAAVLRGPALLPPPHVGQRPPGPSHHRCESRGIGSAHADLGLPRGLRNPGTSLPRLEWARAGREPSGLRARQGAALGWTDLAALPSTAQGDGFRVLAQTHRRRRTCSYPCSRWSNPCSASCRPPATCPNPAALRPSRRSWPRSATGRAGLSPTCTYLTGPSGFNLSLARTRCRTNGHSWRCGRRSTCSSAPACRRNKPTRGPSRS